MDKIAILFGGAGYIGKFLYSKFLTEGTFARIYICDINPIKNTDKKQPLHESLIYLKLDVRKPIKIEIGPCDLKNSWIFNLAAVHREPGHTFQEYFDTNVPGAKHINNFARHSGIKNLFFTSSIAPYGKSLKQRNELSPLYPETAYGISKAIAEHIHQQWLAEENDRRLIIVRPSVIFGPNDPGNVLRMIKALQKGSFILPGGGKMIKGYGYVYGLIESIQFTMSQTEKLILYNYAETPLIPLKEMVAIIKGELGINRPTLSLPISVLVIAAIIIRGLFSTIGKRTDLHPVRVRKAGFPTNVKPVYLIEKGFTFSYDFSSALKHWMSIAPEDFTK